MRKFNLKRKTKNPTSSWDSSELSKLQKSLNKFIDKKLEFYNDYPAVGIVEFLENEKRLINQFDNYDIKMFVAHGLNNISNLCKEMFDLIKKEG